MSALISNDAVISAILSRHSTRAFLPDPVPEEALQKVLACAFASPSSLNVRSWFLSVTDSIEFIDEMSEVIVQEAMLHPVYSKLLADKKDFHAFYHAPLVMMISAVTEDRSGMLNSGIFLENILLAAEAAGLGACPIGFARLLFEGEMAGMYRTRLDIPDTHTPMLGVAIGKQAPACESKPPYPLDWQAEFSKQVAFVR